MTRLESFFRVLGNIWSGEHPAYKREVKRHGIVNESIIEITSSSYLGTFTIRAFIRNIIKANRRVKIISFLDNVLCSSRKRFLKQWTP